MADAGSALPAGEQGRGACEPGWAPPTAPGAAWRAEAGPPGSPGAGEGRACQLARVVQAANASGRYADRDAFQIRRLCSGSCQGPNPFLCPASRTQARAQLGVTGCVSPWDRLDMDSLVSGLRVEQRGYRLLEPLHQAAHRTRLFNSTVSSQRPQEESADEKIHSLAFWEPRTSDFTMTPLSASPPQL